MKLFIFILVVLQSTYGFRSSSPEDCVDFTVSDCKVNPHSVIMEFPIASSIPCQELCRLTSSCIVFQHDGVTCRLLNADYRKKCGTIGSPVDVDVDVCQDALVETCSGFDEEDCVYLGESLGLDPPNGEVSDPLVCQQMCQTFNQMGCNYWVYKDSEQSCRLLRSGKRTCQGISGARAPPMKDCGFWETTIGTTTIRTTKQTPSSCPKEDGFCVLANGENQNEGVIKLADIDEDTEEAQAECLSRCLAHPGATGCEAIWHRDNRGCYVHTQEVDRGNGIPQHFCWVFSKCRGV